MPSNNSGIRDIMVASGEMAGHSVVSRALQAVRAHLGLQIAYVSEFVGNDAVFRTVDAPGLEALIKPGDQQSLDDVYCRHILDGTLPELMPDTSKVAKAAAMPITGAIPIGAHVSVPLRMSDGSIYGMFCCLGPSADESLNPRDLNTMKAFAEIAAFEIDRERQAAREMREKSARIDAILESEAVQIVFQPIWNVRTSIPLGFECLSRFSADPARAPDQWFAEAAEVGKGVEFELMAIRRALDALPAIPEFAYLAVNASPDTVSSPALAALLRNYALDRIVLEITEHNRVQDFDALTAGLAPLRAAGMRLALDDAGSGYSGLQQILQMQPDLIKLDRSLIQGICQDPGRRALAAALMAFARETGSRIVAEGVETEAELAMLRALGIEAVQGYLLGRPQPLEQLLDTLAAPPRAAAG